MFSAFKRLKGKSPRVILYRVYQETRLVIMAKQGAWPKIARRQDDFWTKARAEKLLARGTTVLLDKNARPDFPPALVQKIAARDFRIFEAPIPKTGAWPWHSDWRHGHTWPLRDFFLYQHHEKRSVPYDVKYPWEFGRLTFLLPLMQDHPEMVEQVLADFEKENLLGIGIQWYPMETSMRLITLVLLRDMAVLWHKNINLVQQLSRMIANHAEILSRSLEYTDNRGNHYAANLTALFLAGLALGDEDPSVRKFARKAIDAIPSEIMTQFLDDGVNFEKSAAYHRLVATLFLLCRIALHRVGGTFTPDVDVRLKNAFLFLRHLQKPDGKIPVWGDTDDADPLPLDGLDPDDPSNILHLAAHIFNDENLLPTGDQALATTQLFTPHQLEKSTLVTKTKHYEAGGVMLASDQQTYLLFDAGEVGQRGLGGHGHNDILSSILCLRGENILVDSGCPTYTGDPALRRAFRSAFAHNTLILDGIEIADIKGPFRIAPDAEPFNTSLQEEDGIITLTAGHTGYRRLKFPAEHSRTITFDTGQETLHIVDHVTSTLPRKAERLFHFAPDIKLVREANSLVVLTPAGHRYKITHDLQSRAVIGESLVSYGYGHTAPATVLILETPDVTATTLEMTLLPDNQ